MPLIYKNGIEIVDLKHMDSDALFDLIESIPEDSDEEFCLDSDDEENTIVSKELLENYLERNNISELTYTVPPTEISKENVIEEETATIANTSKNAKPKQLLWRRKQISDKSTKFTGNSDLPEEIKLLQTPYQYFKYFFDDRLMDKIVEESIRFSIQKNVTKPFEFSKADLMKYLGICIITSITSVPNIRLCWNGIVGIDIVRNTLSVNAFERIRSNLHFNCNFSNANYDKLHKLRPIIESLSAKFLSVPMEEMLSIDEQICSTKARHHMKQYMPLKPHKWGYKLFVLSGSAGFCYKFEIYTGTENDPAKRFPNEADLGASSNIVMRLTREIPRHCNYKVYFDNYYTSMSIISNLAKNGIHSLGTVRRNRIPSCKVPSEAEAKKMKRGTSDEFVTDFEGVEISNVYWKDNKLVVFLSSFVGVNPIHTVQRYDRKLKQKIQVSCPAVVKQYNRHMGGVDLLDSLIGRYKIKIRSRKWYIRLFYHLLDITVINAWLLMRRVNKDMPVMKLADFRIELANTLCTINKPTSTKRGRPSSLQKEIEIKRKKPNATLPPPQDVRIDGVNHFPIWNDTRLRCKNPSCNSQTFVVCEKCKTALCFNKDKNCFKIFHDNAY